MTNPTTPFSWQMPTASDLVTDLPADFETFGQAVATSMADLLGGTTGQVLSKASNTDMDFTWVAQDDSNAIQNAIVDAKGDLIAASAADTPARLAVGTNGQVLTADSTASTGLAWATPSTGSSFVAGKNLFLNADFSVWQRGTSFTNPANGTFTADRWSMYYDGSGATRTISQQTFTGDNPSGCNASYYLRFAQSVAGTGGSIANAIFNKIENVRNFNGQTVTVSFWAKADASRTMTLDTYQEFGTGGSGAVFVNTLTASVTTSWTRFSATFTMPSVSGKTITSNSSISHIMGFPINAVGTFDVTGMQLELGSTATTFQTATGTIQGEIAACQRYYWRLANGSNSAPLGMGSAYSTTAMYLVAPMPVTMRTVPSFSISNSAAVGFYSGGSSFTSSAVALDGIPSTSTYAISVTNSGMTAGRVGHAIIGGNYYLELSAEL